MKTVIVGGVAGGASAAARLRRLDENAQIIIFERSGHVSYANCGLPYYIGGVISDADKLMLQTPDTLWARFRIDSRVRHEVLSINRADKTVTVRALDTGRIYEESYDKLLLSPGAIPIRPELPGIDSKRIYTLRTVENSFELRNAAANGGYRSAAVVGGGFIGMEMVENLAKLGLTVTLIEKADQVLTRLDTDMAAFVHTHVKEKGVRLVLGQGVTAFSESGSGVTVLLESGHSVTADMVVLAIGVMPDSRLAKDAGLALGVKESISVNEHMQTSDPDIYAVGDAVEITQSVTGQKAVISLAGPANKQGRIAADNIAGLSSAYNGSVASSAVRVFDMTVASTGINERTAREAGLNCEKVILAPSSHASYYPGARIMTMKLLFDRDNERILGAQIVGAEGVDKRIDVLATAMQAGMKVTELCELDLSYAPPYSSAKDPVNIAGFIAENVITGKVKQFFFETLKSLPRDGSVTLLDTRTDAEYARGHADGFDTQIPVDNLRERLDELDRAKPVYVMCQSGLRSYIACRILSQEGFDCYNFAGGYRLYETLKAAI